MLPGKLRRESDLDKAAEHCPHSCMSVEVRGNDLIEDAQRRPDHCTERDLEVIQHS